MSLPEHGAAKYRWHPGVRPAFCGFLCILASYFLLLPVREDAVLVTGTARLPGLFLASLLATIAVSPFSAALTAIHPLGNGHKAILRTFALVLAGLWFLSVATTTWIPVITPDGISLTTDETGTEEVHEEVRFSPRLHPVVSGVLFVTVNLINVVATSTMWSLCAACFTSQAAQERFGLLSAGATCGQLLGSTAALAFTRWVPSPTRITPTGVPPMMSILLVSALLMLLASRFMATMVSACASMAPTVTKPTHEDHQRSSTAPLPPRLSFTSSLSAPFGPRLASLTSPSSSSSTTKPRLLFLGQASMNVKQFRTLLIRAKHTATQAMKSPYVLLLMAHIGLSAMVSSLVYFQRSLVMTNALKSSQARLSYLASLQSASAVLILILQLGVTHKMMAWLGVGGALCASPLLSTVGFLMITCDSSPVMVGGVEIIRKMTQYSLGKPTREVLFTVLSVDELSSKVMIDALIIRIGDSMAAGVFQVLELKLKMGAKALATFGACACMLWLLVVLQLGRRFRKRQAAAMSSEHAITQDATHHL